MGFRVVVRVGFERETRTAEQRDVISPRRIGYPHGRIRTRPQDQAGRNTQASRAARCLDRCHPVCVDTVTEGQRLHGSVELRVAGRADVGFAVLRIDDSLFRLFYDIQHGSLAFGRAKHADSEIDLFRTGVVLVLGDEPKDGIRRCGLQCLEQWSSPAYWMSANPSLRLYK